MFREGAVLARMDAFGKGKANASTLVVFVVLVVAGSLIAAKPAQAREFTVSTTSGFLSATEQAGASSEYDRINIQSEAYIYLAEAMRLGGAGGRATGGLTIEGNGAKI